MQGARAKWVTRTSCIAEVFCDFSACDLLQGMELELLHPAGASEALVKVLEGLPLLNKLRSDAVLGWDSGGLRAGVDHLAAR